MADSQEDIVRKVRALWAQADHPNTGEEERAVFIAKARALMAKHAIDEIVMQEASGTHEDIVITNILIFEDGSEQEALVPDQRKLLVHYIAMSNRCMDLIVEREASIFADGSAQLAGVYDMVMGFRSDTKLVELLYTNLVSDMIIAFYRTDLRHVKRKAEVETIMANFCQGYVVEIGKRLVEVNREVHRMADDDGGKSLLPVLRSREAAVQDKFNEMFPPDSIETVSTKNYRHHPGAQDAGRAAARRADIGGVKLQGRREALES